MKVLFICSFTRYGKTHVITLKRMCKPAAICQPAGKQNKKQHSRIAVNNGPEIAGLPNLHLFYTRDITKSNI